MLYAQCASLASNIDNYGMFEKLVTKRCVHAMQREIIFEVHTEFLTHTSYDTGLSDVCTTIRLFTF